MPTNKGTLQAAADRSSGLQEASIQSQAYKYLEEIGRLRKREAVLVEALKFARQWADHEAVKTKIDAVLADKEG